MAEEDIKLKVKVDAIQAEKHLKDMKKTVFEASAAGQGVAMAKGIWSGLGMVGAGGVIGLAAGIGAPIAKDVLEAGGAVTGALGRTLMRGMGIEGAFDEIIAHERTRERLRGMGEGAGFLPPTQREALAQSMMAVEKPRMEAELEWQRTVDKMMDESGLGAAAEFLGPVLEKLDLVIDAAQTVVTWTKTVIADALAGLRTIVEWLWAQLKALLDLIIAFIDWLKPAWEDLVAFFTGGGEGGTLAAGDLGKRELWQDFFAAWGEWFRGGGVNPDPSLIRPAAGVQQ